MPKIYHRLSRAPYAIVIIVIRPSSMPVVLPPRPPQKETCYTTRSPPSAEHAAPIPLYACVGFVLPYVCHRINAHSPRSISSCRACRHASFVIATLSPAITTSPNYVEHAMSPACHAIVYAKDVILRAPSARPRHTMAAETHFAPSSSPLSSCRRHLLSISRHNYHVIHFIIIHTLLSLSPSLTATPLPSICHAAMLPTRHRFAIGRHFAAVTSSL